MKVQQQVQAQWQSLSKRSRRVLRVRAKSSPDAVLRGRCQIVLSLVQGRSTSLIHDVRGCSTSQVYRVAKAFIEQGEAGLADRREDNGDLKVIEDYEWWLLIVVCRSPQDYGYRRPTWTQELLIKVLQEKTEILVSRTTMSRLLKRLRIRLGRPKPIVGCPWKKARKTRRLNELRRLVTELPEDEVIVYADEVDIHLNPKIGPDYMLCGTQKTVLTPGQNQKRYLAGAFNARSGRLTWVEADRKNSDLFIRQLWQLVKHDYPDAKCIHIILDNYRIHHSEITKLVLQAIGGKVRLHFLPPYCPDYNKIERVWKDLHDNVTRNHRCRDLPELMGEVHSYLGEKTNSLQRQYANERAA